MESKSKIYRNYYSDCSFNFFYLLLENLYITIILFYKLKKFDFKIIVN